MAHRADVDEGSGIQDGVHGCCVVSGPVRLAAHPRQGGGFIAVCRDAEVMSSGHNAQARPKLVGLDRSKGLRDGIEHALREAMRDGRLVLGAVLPSSRALASDLGVARGTVSAAYAQLAAEGYLDIRQGAPVRVSWLPEHRPPLSSPAPRPVPRWDFRPGRPDSASFSRNAWAKAHRQVMARAPDEIFGYGDPAGNAELRRVLADYLGRAPGVDTDPTRLLICNGFAQALTLTARLAQRAGHPARVLRDGQGPPGPRPPHADRLPPPPR
jgi:hypothetical protein